MVPYDEFGMFHENAAEVGLPFTGPPAVRRTSVDVGGGRSVSALVWGTAPAEYVFLHGGAQNAHTWDTVALALGRPLVAIDLPGHGHSDAGSNGSFDLDAVAADVAVVIRALAPQARVVVGMSLGGTTLLALIRKAPELVRAAVLVDVTPGVTGPKAQAITAFVQGPESFPSFEEILARTIEHNPTRTESSLRRGILHNAQQRPDGSWVWRYRRFPERAGAPDFGALWSVLDTVTVPILLVRGMRPQSVVDDADEAEFLRRAPDGRVVRIADAGHSVQGDTPVEFARILATFPEALEAG
jgi:pimeloyl-ACP methyl ester carboxylesterase